MPFTAPTRVVVDTIDDTVFADLAELAALVAGSVWAGVHLMDSGGARRGANHGTGFPDGTPPLSEAPCGLVMATGRPVVIADTERDRRFPAFAAIGLLSYVGVPIVDRGEPAGVVCVGHDTPYAGDTERLVHALLRVANQVPRHLESQRRLLALEEAATRDEAALSTLERSEASFRTIVSALPDGLLLQDGAGRTLVANQALCRMLDLPDPNGVEGLSRSDLRSRIGARRILKTTQAAVEGGLAVYGREAVLADGRRMEWDYVPLRLADGRERRLWHIRDVTARYVAEERLAASEQRFASLVAAGPATGVFQLSTDGLAVFMDDACRALFDVEPDGPPRPDWGNAVHPDDRDRVLATWNEACVRQVHYSTSYRVVSPSSGRVRMIEVEAAPLRDADGVFTGFVGTMTDITENVETRRARERADALARREHQRLSDLVAGSPEAILGISGDGRILSMNPAALTTFAMTRQEAVGKSLCDLVSGADRLFLRSTIEEVLWETRRTTAVQVLAVGARPRMFLAQLTLIPMRPLEGEGEADDAVALTAIFSDVSDHHRAELEHIKRLETERSARVEAEGARAELAARLEELHAVTTAKDTFVSMISHELRTPLTSIRTFAELMAMDGDRDVADDEPVAVIVRNVERLERIVGDLLEVKAGIDTSNLALEELDLRRLVAHELQALRPSALAAGIELVAVDGPPVLVLADRGRVGQVIVNLVDNALKFTPAGERVVVEVDARDGGAILEVRDTGCGIAEEELPRVFERFYQGGAGRALARGSGLGLAIAQLIAEVHGGQMDVSSRVGVGTTFTMTLPDSRPAALAALAA